MEHHGEDGYKAVGGWHRPLGEEGFCGREWNADPEVTGGKHSRGRRKERGCRK